MDPCTRMRRPPRLGPKRAPRERQAHAIAPCLEGQRAVPQGEAWLRAFGRLSTARVLQEARAQEQREALGRSRDARQPLAQGARQGQEEGTGKTAEGVCRLPGPPGRGRREPSRSHRWAARGRTRAVLTRLSGELAAGGRAPRARARALAKALGQWGGATRAVRHLPDRLPHASEACRSRARRGCALASRWLEPVDEPRRRWGSPTGRRGVWGLWVAGRPVVRTRAPAPSARAARCLEVGRARVQRGLPPPVTLTTDGAPGLRQARAAMGPPSLRMRGGLHPLQQRHATVPPQAWPAGQACGAARREAPTCEAGHRWRPPLLDASPAPCPAACRGLEDEAAARLTHWQVPARHRQEGRTAHLAERACAEARRRTKVMPPRWEAASGVPLVCAVLSRVRERWGKQPFRECAQHQSRALRQA